MRVQILDGDKVVFVGMTVSEALRTMESLAKQLRTNNPNTERFETHDETGILFTIAVIDLKE